MAGEEPLAVDGSLLWRVFRLCGDVCKRSAGAVTSVALRVIITWVCA
jgi:hypothetical protein